MSLKIGGTIKFSANKTTIRVADEVRKNTITSALPGDLEFRSSDDTNTVSPVAIGSELNSGTDGDLLLKGKILGQKRLTVYVDGGVFERGDDGVLDVAYAYIGSEGREIYDYGKTTGSRQFYIKDHLGSTRMAITDLNEIVDATSYQPYGRMVELHKSAGTAIKEKFTGKEYDKEGGDENGGMGIGLFYFGKRYYDAEIGRWTSCDLKHEFFSPYTYVGNNPTGFIDPNGLWSKTFTQMQYGISASGTYYTNESSLSLNFEISRKNGFDLGAEAVFMKHTEYEGNGFEGNNTNITLGKFGAELAAKWMKGFGELFKFGGKLEATTLSVGQHVEGYNENLDVNLNIGAFSKGLMISGDKEGVNKIKGTSSDLIGVSAEIEKK